MHQPASHNTQTNRPGHRQDNRAQAIPTRIAAFLTIVRALLGFGQHLDKTVPAQIDHPRFPTLAVGVGTHDLRRILAHVQRGILRAIMLEKYLLARADQGRDIEPTPIPEPADEGEIAALDLKSRPQSERSKARPRRPIPDPNDPFNFAIPSLKELEAQVRRRSVGRTVTEICLDLGISPASCDGAFWHEIYLAISNFGGSFHQFHEVQTQRREAFQKERDKRPDTWTWQIWDKPKDAVRQMLGFLLGEPNATAPSG